MVNKLRKTLVAAAFGLFRFFPMKKRVVLANFSTGALEGNLKVIYEELLRRGKGDQVVLLLHKSKGNLNGKIVYLIHMIKAAWYLATSRVFVVDDYFYPLYVVKLRKETFVLQVWHACGAFKKFGYSVLDKSFGASKAFVDTVRIHSNYHMVLVSAPEVAPHFAEAFHTNLEKMATLGIPRTDAFFDREALEAIKTRLGETYPQTKHKKVILYAPTFRGDSRFSATGGFALDLPLLKETLGGEYLLLVKLHPFALKDFPQGWEEDDFVLNLSEKEDINELLVLCDLLITDYSSVVFEGALLEKPMIFFAYDLEDYVAERDFYYDYKSFVPGPIVGTTRELIQVMERKAWDVERLRAFKKRFFEPADGKATARVVDILLQRCETP